MNNRRRIDLYQLFLGIKRRYRILLVWLILGFFGGGVYTYFIKVPTYQVSTQLVVRSLSGGGLSSTNIQEIDGTLSVINTYADIIVSPKILDQVISKLNLSTTPAALKQTITPTNGTDNNSQVITLTVDYSNPYMAANIANTTAAVFKEDIPHIMNVANVTILSKADAKEHLVPIAPNREVYTIVSTLIGLIAGLICIVLLSLVDTSIRTEKEVSEILNLPILGTMPTINLIESVRNTKGKKNKKNKIKKKKKSKKSSEDKNVKI